jgi:hypothetical protein
LSKEDEDMLKTAIGTDQVKAVAEDNLEIT